METDIVPPTEALIDSLTFNPFTMETLLGLLVLVLLLSLSALISGSEVAFFSLEPKELEALKLSDNRKSKLVLQLLAVPDRLLATILVANNFVNIAIIILSSYITNSLIDFSSAPTLGFLFQTVLITFLLLLFGEIVPKVYATHYAMSFSVKMAQMLKIFGKLFSPLNTILINSTSFVNTRMQKNRKNVSIDEISQALQLTDQIELSEDKEILEGIVKFGNKTVNDIMRPRMDIIAIDVTDHFANVLKTIQSSGYSRIPVYTETLDNIKGILYIKDLLPHLHKGDSFRWQTLIRPPFFVPETKKIDDLLEEFQKSKIHMAIVVDEYGGTSGLVTLEDVLEEIVGDIADEFDTEEKTYTQISENEYIFDAKTTLNDFFKVIDSDDTIFDDVKGDADTLAGLILELKGEFPHHLEKLKCKNFLFSIEAIDARRIKKIKIIVGPVTEKKN